MNPVLYYVIKVALSAAVIVAASEAAKRSSLLGALIVSLPLTSLLAFVWLWLDTHDPARIEALSWGIFWLILPSFALFALLPVLLKAGWSFWAALGAAIAATVVGYRLMVLVMGRFGIGA